MGRHPLRSLFDRLTNRLEVTLQRQRLVSRPLVVDVVLTKACNLACTFCRDYEHPGAKRISSDDMERVAGELFPTARWISLCSGGEPYLHPGLEQLLRLGAEHGCRTWVLSNAMLLDENRMAAIVDEQLITRHGFSVDGIRPETVASIRVGAQLSKIQENIGMLLRLRERSANHDEGVVIRYALMRRNIEELPDALRYWGDRGITRFDCGYLNLANGIPREESLFFHQTLMSRVFDTAREIASTYPGLELQLPPTVSDEQRKQTHPVRCTAPWDFVMIDTSGQVLPCYRAFEALQMGQLYLGEASFDEIWNSPDYQALRKTVNDDSDTKHYEYCRVCERRRGWGQLDVHLGDETWRALAYDNADEAAAVDHRRAGFRSFEESDRQAAGPTAGQPSARADTEGTGGSSCGPGNDA